MDVEVQEKVILLGTSVQHWGNTDMMVEVGSEENAAAIYEHLKKIGVRAFAQKLGWRHVESRMTCQLITRTAVFLSLGNRQCAGPKS